MRPNPLIRFPDATIELPLQYFGSVEYYALMSAFGHVVIDDTARFDKRFKSAHRCLIADTRGPLQLTVPISKDKEHRNSEPAIRHSSSVIRHSDTDIRHSSLVIRNSDTDIRNSTLTWNQVKVSDHGQWWQDVDVSLASAYGRTPFYEFYIERLRCYFDRNTPTSFQSVADLDIAADASIRAILGLQSVVAYKSAIAAAATVSESENAPLGLSYKSLLPQLQTAEYYQVRRDKLGFIPSLSILDLIFNLGPEAPLLLQAMTSKL